MNSRKMQSTVACLWIFTFMVLLVTGCASQAVKSTTPEPTAEYVEAPAAEGRKADVDTKAAFGDKSDAVGLAEESAATSAPGEAPAPRAKRRPNPKGPSGLSAGFSDDNKQFNYFLNFLDTYKDAAPHYPVDVSERIMFRVMDAAGQSLPNANVAIYADQEKVAGGKTLADGTFLFFPSRFNQVRYRYTAEIEYQQTHVSVPFERFGKRDINVTLDYQRGDIRNVPLDIVFFMDTTGSMGEEIARLKRTIELIYLNLSALPSKPSIRFGMVLYKDRKDAYRTKIVPLTADLETFQKALNRIRASGGGDHPEDLQEALDQGLHELDWNTDGIRLGFIITDAPPHLDYGQSFSYDKAALFAKEKGIKLFSMGTGGLDIAGEYVLRQISQITSAVYIFLTYGEKGEAEGGKIGSVSHHTGANFQTDKLEAIVIHMVKEELAQLEGRETATQYEDNDYLEAVSVDTESREETLRKLFDQAVSQLVDYSSLRIQDRPPVTVLPVVPAQPDERVLSEYLTENIVMAMNRSKQFTLVERGDLQGLKDELKFGMSGYVEEDRAAEVGHFIGADIIVTSKCYTEKNTYALYIKFIRVETAEMLSVTKVVIERALVP